MCVDNSVNRGFHLNYVGIENASKPIGIIIKYRGKNIWYNPTLKQGEILQIACENGYILFNPLPDGRVHNLNTRQRV